MQASGQRAADQLATGSKTARATPPRRPHLAVTRCLATSQQADMPARLTAGTPRECGRPPLQTHCHHCYACYASSHTPAHSPHQPNLNDELNVPIHTRPRPIGRKNSRYPQRCCHRQTTNWHKHKHQLAPFAAANLPTMNGCPGPTKTPPQNTC